PVRRRDLHPLQVRLKLPPRNPRHLRAHTPQILRLPARLNLIPHRRLLIAIFTVSHFAQPPLPSTTYVTAQSGFLKFESHSISVPQDLATPPRCRAHSGKSSVSESGVIAIERSSSMLRFLIPSGRHSSNWRSGTRFHSSDLGRRSWNSSSRAMFPR